MNNLTSALGVLFEIIYYKQFYFKHRALKSENLPRKLRCTLK